jgi:hypothetical protein
MGRLLALLPVIGLTVLLLAWASAPAVDAMAPTVAAGAADGLRSIGVGCGVALVVLAAGATAIGLLITATTRADRQWVRYVEAECDGASREYPVAPASRRTNRPQRRTAAGQVDAALVVPGATRDGARSPPDGRGER